MFDVNALDGIDQKVHKLGINVQAGGMRRMLAARSIQCPVIGVLCLCPGKILE